MLAGLEAEASRCRQYLIAGIEKLSDRQQPAHLCKYIRIQVPKCCDVQGLSCRTALKLVVERDHLEGFSKRTKIDYLAQSLALPIPRMIV